MARDVAGSTDGVQNERIARYLEGRTAFFVRVVVRALERGTLQVISVAELAAGRELLDSARRRVSGDDVSVYDGLAAALASADGGDGLPEGLIHADFVPANAIAASGGTLVIVDWAGAGRGPRLWALAFLLWAAGNKGMSHVDAVMAGYREHVDLEPSELSRLPECSSRGHSHSCSWASQAAARIRTRFATASSAHVAGSPGLPPASTASSWRPRAELLAFCNGLKRDARDRWLRPPKGGEPR